MTKVLLDLALPISGMSCASCVSHVEGALKDLQGVRNVVVNLATNKASLSYDPQLVKVNDMQRAVEDVGYGVTVAELTLDVQGMTCASCVSHVEGGLNELDGVTAATVNLGLGTAKVIYIPGVVSVSTMKKAIQQVGYEARERSEGADALDRAEFRARRDGGERTAPFARSAARPRNCRGRSDLVIRPLDATLLEAIPHRALPAYRNV